MAINEEMEYDPKKRAVYESYLNYMMVPTSSVYDYQIIETPPERLKEEEAEEES